MGGTPRIFVDMDGVLADFDTHYENMFGTRSSVAADNVDWNAVAKSENFFLGIPPMPDMKMLWTYLEPFEPIVLTGVPARVPEATDNKREWVRAHLGAGVEIRCCPSKEKCLHADRGDVLIDDWEKYKDLWLARGGRWITHVSADRTIASLKAMGIG